MSATRFVRLTIISLWLTLVLPTAAQTPDPPDWLARLFSHTGKPDHLAHRLRRIDAREVNVNGVLEGVVTVELTYPGLDGRDETGQARIFLPPSVKEDPSRKVALVHNAGYEVDEKGAAGLVKKGYAVCTPHASPLNPLGRGINLDNAILHAARQLPCIDPLRVSIQGGSAGGWMTLMMAADAFPIVWAMPDVPPIHWGYNAAYISEQHAAAGPPPGSDKPRMPYLAMVNVIVEQDNKTYGMPLDSPAYLAVSPLAHLETITAPTLVLFSTADILVPVDQVGRDLVKPKDTKLFPEGYTTEMTDRFPGVGGKRTLLAALPRSRYELFKIAIPKDPPPVRVGATPPSGAKPISLPFTRDRVWSIAVVDEGAVEPVDAHTKYQLGWDHEPFRKWAEEHGVTADQLTLPKLERLMKRLRGELWRRMRIRPGGEGAEIWANQLDYTEAERADVLVGLTAFASEDLRANRLSALYSKLPKRLKALGGRLGDGTAESVRAALRAPGLAIK